MIEKNKYKNAIEIQNFITSIISKTKKNDISKINQLSNLIENNNFDITIKFILDNNINLTNLTGISYSFMKILYSETNIDISKLEEYILLKKIFSKKENTDFYLEYLKKEYKSPNRKKGDLFKKIILNYKYRFNDFPIFTNISQISPNIENYIYIPEIDSHIFEILSSIGFELKNINTNKGRDILIKKSNNYYIGEAKEIHESGGSQNNQLKDLESALKIKDTIDGKLNLQGFGILYGASIFYKNKYQEAINKNILAFSIDEFIFDFQNTLNVLEYNI